MRLVRLYTECCTQVRVDSEEFSIRNIRGWPYRSALPQAHTAEQHANERDLLDCHFALPSPLMRHRHRREPIS